MQQPQKLIINLGMLQNNYLADVSHIYRSRGSCMKTDISLQVKFVGNPEEYSINNSPSLQLGMSARNLKVFHGQVINSM